ncbi:TetR family transcriptional regulator [Nocardia sp. NPDC019395]|uniref:TetR/AcrR family transcriptional regulator n=1 Tax=Nocardia sp. NPDC019395 TaxID=3154686 RepID=UPI0033C724B9
MTEHGSNAETATPRGTARRTAICEAVLDLAATGGSRAVSHPAIDRRLELPRGSTSYYYRTRRELLDAAITHLTGASRDAFHTALDQKRDFSIESATDLITTQLDLLLGPRRRDALARYALSIDSALGDDLRTALAGCLFSLPAAQSLMSAFGAPDPHRAAHDLISLLEGLLFDRLHGTRSLTHIEPGTPAGLADLRPAVHQWLTTLTSHT